MLARRLADLAIALLLVEVTVRLAIHEPHVRERLPCDVGHEATCGIRLYVAARGRVTDFAWDPDRGWRNRSPDPTEIVDGARVHPDPGADRPDRPRVLLVGDSYTYGVDAAATETFAAQLAALRPDLDVRNHGVPGYGHDQALLTLRAEGPRLRPAVVVLGLTAVDVARNGLALTTQPKPWFTLDDDALVLHGAPVPRPTAWAWGVETSWWTGAVLRGLVQRSADPAAEEARLAALTDAILDATEAEARALGATFLAVRLPLQPDGTAYLFDDADAACARWCARHADACLDVIPDFRAAWARGVDTTAGHHWTAAGHAIVAERLAAAIPAAVAAR
jgi:hypothetical protein